MSEDYTAYGDEVRGAEKVLSYLEIMQIVVESAGANTDEIMGHRLAIDQVKAMLLGMKAKERRQQKLDRERSVQQAQEQLRDSFPGPRGAEKSEPYIGAKTYEGVFRGTISGERVIRVRAVQWDGTKEHYEVLKAWVDRVRPIQGLDYFAEPDSYLHTDGPSFTLGLGNDFGDFTTAVGGYYLYLKDGNRFNTSPADTFEERFKEVTGG